MSNGRRPTFEEQRAGQTMRGLTHKEMGVPEFDTPVNTFLRAMGLDREQAEKKKKEDFAKWNAQAKLMYQEASLLPEDERRAFMAGHSDTEWARGLKMTKQLSGLGTQPSASLDWRTDFEDYSALARGDFPDLSALDDAMTKVSSYDFSLGNKNFERQQDLLDDLQSKRSFVSQNYGLLNTDKLKRDSRYRNLEAKQKYLEKKYNEALVAQRGAIAKYDAYVKEHGEEAAKMFLPTQEASDTNTYKEMFDEANKNLESFQNRKNPSTGDYIYYYGGKRAQDAKTPPPVTEPPEWYDEEILKEKIGDTEAYKKDPAYTDIINRWLKEDKDLNDPASKAIWDELIAYKPPKVVINRENGAPPAVTTPQTGTKKIRGIEVPVHAGLYGAGKKEKKEEPKVPRPKLPAGNIIQDKDGNQYKVGRTIQMGWQANTVKVYPVKPGTREPLGKRHKPIYIPWGEIGQYTLLK